MLVDRQTKLERARLLARRLHGSQKYGELPYEFHLQAVVEVLLRAGARPNDEQTAPLLVAAWLHDALEDTEIERHIIIEEFGPDIADIVWRVTDEPGTNRRERKTATYRKTSQSEAATIVKLADRIANAEASSKNNANLFRMYAKEQPAFSEALRNQAHGELTQRLWKRLDQIFADNISGSVR